MNTKSFTEWTAWNSNKFIPSKESKIVKNVDPGIYKIRFTNDIGYYLFKKNHTTDELLEFPSSIHTSVLNEIKNFNSLRENFEKYKFAYKRGILLHGKPGSGKSCTIALVIKYYIEELNGVVFTINNGSDLDSFMEFVPETFRQIESDRPLLVVIEDLDGLCYSADLETRLLQILDGLDQFENVVYMATTNYIEKLKERIINRPSRFDRRIYVPFLSYADRLYYFQQKISEEDKHNVEIKKWAYDTEDMSIAHLSELIKLVLVFKQPYEQSISELRELNNCKKLSSHDYEKNNHTIGFSSKKSDLLEKKMAQNTDDSDDNIF